LTSDALIVVLTRSSSVLGGRDVGRALNRRLWLSGRLLAAGSSAISLGEGSAGGVSVSPVASAGSSAGAPLPLPFVLRRGELSVTCPAAACAIGDRSHDQAARRIASSLPGMMKSASSGSQFVSTRAMIGRRAAGLAYRELFHPKIDDEDSVRLPAKVGDASEVRFDFSAGEQRDPLLRWSSSS
jgi:hypothetical protein